VKKEIPLKLSIIYTDLSLGGIQRKIVDLLNYIDKNQLDQVIQPEVILRWKTEFNLIPNLSTKKFKIYYPPRIFPFPRRRMSFLFNIIRRFIINPPDIILTHVFSSSMRAIPLARILFGKKVKIIISQDNIFSYENNRWYEKLFVSPIYSMANKIIVQTETSKNDLVKNWKINKNKIEVIPNWSRKMGKNVKKIRNTDLVYCGRFEDQKNLLRLLGICKLLVQKNNDLKVKIIGSGRQELSLKKFVLNNQLDHNILFVSPTNQVEKHLVDSKIFVLTSRFEGQPMALLEAMSCCCVPIITDFPGAREYIKNKENGYIAKTDEIFVKYVESCLKNDNILEKLSSKAKLSVLENYSEKNIQKYVDLIVR